MFFKSFQILNSKYAYQFLATLIIQFLSFSHGIGLGWLAPTLHNIQSSLGPFTVTVDQASWIGSLYGLGSLFGNIVFGFLLNILGRKLCLYLLAGPHMIAWVLIYFSNTFFYLYVSRFLFGMTSGGCYVVIPIFVSEIADPSKRGMLSFLSMVFVGLGLLIGFVLATYLDYYLIPCVVIVLPIVYLLAITILPESPQYLLRKHKIEKAQKSYEYYKNIKNSGAADAAEFEEFKNSILKANDNGNRLKLKDFVNPEFLKPLTLGLLLVFLNQFSGLFPFFSYMSTIFAESGTDIDANTCTVIMGVAQVAGTCLTLFIVDRFGRKIIMIISCGCMALGLIIFGFYIKFTTADTRSQLSWVPLVLMLFIILTGSIGVMGLFFTIVVESLPVKVQCVPIGSSICMAGLSILMFVSLKVFPIILNDFGLDVLLFSCAGVCIVCWFYIVLFQKETKGINLNK